MKLTGPKSTVEEITARFDREVDRFSNLETGQTATMDAPLTLDLISEAAAMSTPHARHVLDVGCGAGNYTLKLLERLPGLEVTLVDLSRPMLEKAEERLRAAGCTKIHQLHGDIRQLELPSAMFDIILASQVLHHLREESEWELVFGKFAKSLVPRGSLWVNDLVAGATPELEAMFWRRYGEYLSSLGGDAHRDHVFAYVEKEDTPRPLVYQLELLRRVGFRDIEVLHKRTNFAAYGAIKPA